MRSAAMQTLLLALGHLEQEHHRCERRLQALRELRAWREAQGLHAEAKPERKTSGWTEEKRLAVSVRMRAYWAQRRSGQSEAPAAPANEDQPRKKTKKMAGAHKEWSDESRAQAKERLTERWRVRRVRTRPPTPPSVPQ